MSCSDCDFDGNCNLQRGFRILSCKRKRVGGKDESIPDSQHVDLVAKMYREKFSPKEKDNVRGKRV